MRARKVFSWVLALALGGSIVAASPLQAVAQYHDDRSWHCQDRDRDRDRDQDRDNDNNHRNRNWDWYDNGRSRAADRDRDRDDEDRDRGNDRNWGQNRGPYGQYGNDPYANGRFGRGRQVGYQDGLNDGRNDRTAGHSCRPTQDSNYRHADRGYSAMFGDKGSYQQAYRDAYLQGYQQGYGAQGACPRR